MAAHCSILAWRIPRIQEPGGLQAMGSHRAGLKSLCTHALRLLFHEGLGNRRGHRNGCLQATGSELAILKPMSLNYLFRIKHVGAKKNAPIQLWKYI